MPRGSSGGPPPARGRLRPCSTGRNAGMRASFNLKRHARMRAVACYVTFERLPGAHHGGQQLCRRVPAVVCVSRAGDPRQRVRVRPAPLRAGPRHADPLPDRSSPRVAACRHAAHRCARGPAAGRSAGRCSLPWRPSWSGSFPSSSSSRSRETRRRTPSRPGTGPGTTSVRPPTGSTTPTGPSTSTIGTICSCSTTPRAACGAT